MAASMGAVVRGAAVRLVAAAALLAAPAAGAVTLTSLKDFRGDDMFGQYAPRGDCSREPRVTIEEAGFTFRAAGQTLTSRRFELSYSFFGMRYEGITLAFYPFAASASDLGPLILFVNDSETRGRLAFTSNLAPGQRMQPLHAALLAGSPLLRCRGTGGAAAPAQAGGAGAAGAGAAAGAAAPVPAGSAAGPAPLAASAVADWATLPALVGRWPGTGGRDLFDMLGRGEVAQALRARLGPKMPVLERNLGVVGPLERQGSLYWVRGNAQGLGGEEMAYVLLDAGRRAVQVGLWERGKLTVFAPPGGRLPVPPDIARMLAESPPETAVALPGLPWEVVPVDGRPPMAHVFAAGSPSITSMSLFCEGARPMLAMLTGKSLAGAQQAVTWNFAGRIVTIPVVRGNQEGTFWQGSLAGTPLLALLLQQAGAAELRINQRGEGQALLANAPAAIRTAMRGCMRA